MTDSRPHKKPRYDLRTTRGYDLFEAVSALQKGIRRADARLAGYFAMELHESGYGALVWRRLLTISAEDVHGLITQEIEALYRSWEAVRAANPKGTSVFVAKAVLLLSHAVKSRDADHLACLLYNRKIGITDEELLKDLEEARAEAVPIPEYALDAHTRRGRIRGKTKAEFFQAEHAALQPRIHGLFDDVLAEWEKTRKEETVTAAENRIKTQDGELAELRLQTRTLQQHIAVLERALADWSKTPKEEK